MSVTFTFQMQPSSLCSSTHSALNLNIIESWEQRKYGRLQGGIMCGEEQGKAGRGGSPHQHPRHVEEGDSRVPSSMEQGWMPKANVGRLPHDHRPQQYQYSSLQPTATTKAYSSQVWIAPPSKERIVLLCLRDETAKQFWHRNNLFTLSIRSLPPTACYPQLHALILNYWQLYANTACILILEILHWKEAVPSSRQLNCSNRFGLLLFKQVVTQSLDHFLSSRKQSRHVIARSSSTPPHTVGKRI